MAKFPCLRLAYEAARPGAAKTIALNAADEVAVAAFLEEQIAFEEIPANYRRRDGCNASRANWNLYKKYSMSDSEARQLAREKVNSRGRTGISPVRAIS